MEIMFAYSIIVTIPADGDLERRKDRRLCSIGQRPYRVRRTNSPLEEHGDVRRSMGISFDQAAFRGGVQKFVEDYFCIIDSGVRAEVMGSAWRCTIFQVPSSGRKIIVTRKAAGEISLLAPILAFSHSIWTM